MFKLYPETIETQPKEVKGKLLLCIQAQPRLLPIQGTRKILKIILPRLPSPLLGDCRRAPPLTMAPGPHWGILGGGCNAKISLALRFIVKTWNSLGCSLEAELACQGLRPWFLLQHCERVHCSNCKSNYILHYSIEKQPWVWLSDIRLGC